MGFQWMKLSYSQEDSCRKIISRMERSPKYHRNISDCIWDLCCSLWKSDETVIIVKDNSMNIEGYEFQWLVIVNELYGNPYPLAVWGDEKYKNYEECRKSLDSQKLHVSDEKYHVSEIQYEWFITIHKKKKKFK